MRHRAVTASYWWSAEEYDGLKSVPALLVSIGAPRLEALGVRVPRVLPIPSAACTSECGATTFRRAVEAAFGAG